MSVELQKQVCEIIDVIMFKKISVEVFSYWFEDSGNDIQELGSTSWHVYWWFSSHDLPILSLFSSTSAWLLRECTQKICHPRTLLPWTLQPGKYFGCIQVCFGHYLWYVHVLGLCAQENKTGISLFTDLKKRLFAHHAHEVNFLQFFVLCDRLT